MGKDKKVKVIKKTVTYEVVSDEEPEEKSKNSGCADGCAYAFALLIVIGLLYYFWGRKDNTSTSQKPKIEQVSTQTKEEQSTYTASDTVYLTTSKTTASGSDSTYNSYSSTSESASVSQDTSATSATLSSEYDESYQTYLALSTLLESDGKSLKLREAQGETNEQVTNVIEKMSQLRDTKYYNNALKDLVRCCPKYAKEYSKNGKYFASEAEFYQSYINPDYSSILKAKKKESR